MARAVSEVAVLLLVAVITIAVVVFFSTVVNRIMTSSVPSSAEVQIQYAEAVSHGTYSVVRAKVYNPASSQAYITSIRVVKTGTTITPSDTLAPQVLPPGQVVEVTAIVQGLSPGDTVVVEVWWSSPGGSGVARAVAQVKPP